LELCKEVLACLIHCLRVTKAEGDKSIQIEETKALHIIEAIFCQDLSLFMGERQVGKHIEALVLPFFLLLLHMN
jgi:hypothetical protein